jgi:hypothetical protein
MNQFGLIIEETTAGSNLQFVSSHLDTTSPEIKETLTDERTLASQLANLSDVYSVQVTKNFKIYSLIVTNLRDFLGRSGYYAIRLYAPKNVNLNNFENILASLKEKYNNYTNTSNLNSQNYNEILSSILVVENDKKNYVSLESHLISFYYFDDNNPILSTVFNTNGTYLVQKLYAFNKNKAVPEHIALSAGLKPFSTINSNQKEIDVVNNFGILKELWINEQIVDFNPILTNFLLLCQNTDKVTYTTTDDKTIRVITNSHVEIEPKFIPRPPLKKTNKKKGFLEESVIYLIIILMIGLIGGGSWYYFLGEKDSEIETPSQNDIENSKDENLNIEELNQITFEFDGTKSDSVFKTNYPKLEKYRFKFGQNKWNFKNTEKENPTYKPFYKETIEEINKVDSLKLDENKKNQFLTNLKQTSGQEVKNKEIEKKPENKKPTQTVIDKKPAKSEKGNEPKITPKPKSDDIKEQINKNV